MKRSEHPKLGQATATAICGNDILSSALYVSGIAILFAGIYAPLVLLFIGFVLYLYKKVYTEVVEALPVNGGAYNCLLNATSKTIAAVAGIMTFLSYIATAVISAKVGVEYLGIGLKQAMLDLGYGAFEMHVIPVTIVVLFLFALLVISGVKDSAKVALGIFILHIITLVLFLGVGAWHAGHGMSLFAENFARTGGIIQQHGGLLMTLYLAFSASLLGVSGFESSANFVEEQDRGVFRKTLRNMLVGVVIFNPLIALIVLNSMPYDAILAAKDFLLADAARAIGGLPLLYLVSADAFLVLCGAVLTAYVGVSGLLHRMSADSCLPNFLGKQNRRKSFPRIVLLFFFLCSSILIMTQGDLLSLAGVYTIAFLGVMSMFALGNLILKESRTELKRTYSAPVIAVVIALLATSFGMIGNIRINPENLTFFELYFIPTLLIVLCMIYQDYLLKFAMRVTQHIPPLHHWLHKHFSDLTEGRFVAFVHHVSRLRPVLEYINRNETGWNITLIHCKDGDFNEKTDKHFQEIKRAIPELQKAGFYPHFRLTLLYKDKEFGPETIKEISRDLKIRKNRIMIGSIHNFHAFEYGELGGVRIIFG